MLLNPNLIRQVYIWAYPKEMGTTASKTAIKQESKKPLDVSDIIIKDASINDAYLLEVQRLRRLLHTLQVLYYRLILNKFRPVHLYRHF